MLVFILYILYKRKKKKKKLEFSYKKKNLLKNFPKPKAKQYTTNQQ